jgi:hypothetical protein
LTPHPLNANVPFLQVFKKSHPVLNQTQGTGTDFTENSIEKWAMYPTRPKATADIEKPTCYVTLPMRTGERPTLYPPVVMLYRFVRTCLVWHYFDTF